MSTKERKGASFNGVRSAVISLIILFVSAAAATGSQAQEVRMVLDSFSFFFFEGAGTGAQIPAGTSVPVSLSRLSGDSWRTVVEAGALEFPELLYPSGKRVRWRLSKAAYGTLVPKDDGLVWSMNVEAMAFVENHGEGIPFSFRFTTESTRAEAGAYSAMREGSAVDPGSGSFQMVASGVNPTTAASAPGKPFYVVLSGRLEGAPQLLRAP